MEDLYDIHIHLIHGVDDGPGDLEEAVGMLKQAAEDGIRTIIATPHKRYGMFEYDIGVVEEHYRELKEIAEDMGIRLYLGCEYHACSDMVEDLKTGKVHTLADTDYVLCEFAHLTTEVQMQDAVYSLTANGYKPVIAHAERYEAIQKDPEFCRELKKRGAFIQINAGSIFGEDGHMIRKTARILLKNGLADAVASDAHGTKYRKSSLAKAYGFVVKRYTERYARDIFLRLPQDILKDISVSERNVPNE